MSQNEGRSVSPDRLYREQADYLLRENMNKLKGLIDLLVLGAYDEMNGEEKAEFLRKIAQYTDSLYQKLERSISPDA